ncbi:MAG: hypothetical protein JRJ39_12215 [Deltaproteobacteria bacterium]|nr:hypothetical protein [Deltaproteobacteria bacterium]MBW1848112.1 hypothetical protein [Deltaproteobacteria bacterium]
MNSKQDILILAKTYPEISRKYDETVCTVGILSDTKKLIRLYPIRFRYLEGEFQFKKYQWIRAKIQKANSDSRPESYNPVEDTIEIGDIIGTDDDWHEREKWVVSNDTLFKSVEDLLSSQKQNKTSLGIVKPKEILDFSIEEKSEEDIKEGEIKKKSIISQRGLFEQPKDLELLPVRLVLKFKCDDLSCRSHSMSILDWEFGQLYRKVKESTDWKQKITDKVMSICGPEREPYFILGNIARWQHTFCILGFFYPPKRRQMRLF